MVWQMVSADYSLNPTITFSNRDAGGIGGALSALRWPRRRCRHARRRAYNQLVRAVRNYRPQVIEGGLGTGGKIEVQGADEAAGESDSTPQKKPAAKTKKKTKTTQ